MLRHIIALGALAAITVPAAAQVDTSRDARRYAFNTSSREGWLGIGISCSRCTLSESDGGGARQWTFSEPPLVFSVDRDGPADKAALRTGDTLVAIDGAPFTSVQGGAAFANIRPGQNLRLTYRRDGKERTVRLIATRHPVTRDMELAARALRRAQEQQERTLATSREQLERSGRVLDELRVELAAQARRAQGGRDSATLEQIERMRDALAEQQEALARTLAERATLEGRHPEALRPLAEPPEPASPAEPAMPAQPAMPAMPAMPAEAPMPAMPPMSYREHRGFGPLRYTGRLGDVVIEARGPGGVTSTEVSDSEVVITSGDMSVRLALRPRATPPPARAPQARPPRD